MHGPPTGFVCSNVMIKYAVYLPLSKTGGNNCVGSKGGQSFIDNICSISEGSSIWIVMANNHCTANPGEAMVRLGHIYSLCQNVWVFRLICSVRELGPNFLHIWSERLNCLGGPKGPTAWAKRLNCFGSKGWLVFKLQGLTIFGGKGPRVSGENVQSFLVHMVPLKIRSSVSLYWIISHSG